MGIFYQFSKRNLPLAGNGGICDHYQLWYPWWNSQQSLSYYRDDCTIKHSRRTLFVYMRYTHPFSSLCLSCSCSLRLVPALALSSSASLSSLKHQTQLYNLRTFTAVDPCRESVAVLLSYALPACASRARPERSSGHSPLPSGRREGGREQELYNLRTFTAVDPCRESVTVLLSYALPACASCARPEHSSGHSPLPSGRREGGREQELYNLRTFTAVDPCRESVMVLLSYALPACASCARPEHSSGHSPLPSGRTEGGNKNFTTSVHSLL